MRLTRSLACLGLLVSLVGCGSSSGDADAAGTSCSAGASCASVGAMCGQAFEFSGYRCVGPEQVWAACYPYNGLGPPGPANGCPSAAPAEGSPCCRAYVAGLPHGCLVGDARWECVSDHWTRVP